MEQKIRVKKLDPRARLPVYESALAAGADLCACMETDAVIAPGETVFIPTGLTMEIPEGYAGLIYARSGLAGEKGLAPANKVGVIDADYRGEILVALHNHGKETQQVKDGDRIAQLVVTPFLKGIFEETEELTDTKRGAGGFGSTGN